jgi:hypothetical protein
MTQGLSTITEWDLLNKSENPNSNTSRSMRKDIATFQPDFNNVDPDESRRLAALSEKEFLHEESLSDSPVSYFVEETIWGSKLKDLQLSKIREEATPRYRRIISSFLKALGIVGQKN